MSLTHPRLLALIALLGALLLAGVAAPGAHAQATRTWVSGVGDDVNPCSRTAPCKTFAGSISKTAAGGVVNTLDPGGFGTVTITKSITIDGSAGGGILAAGTSGVIINAAPTDDVRLRNLDVQVATPSVCGTPTAAGIRVLSARSVAVEGGSFGGIGTAILAAPTASSTDLVVDGATLRGAACDAAISVAPTGTGTVDATIRNSSISNFGSGLRVADAGRAWVSGSLITGNTLGLEPLGTGTITDYFGTNQIHGNGTDGTPTSVIGAPVPGPAGAPGAAGLVGPAGPAGPAGRSSTNTTPTPAKRCVVPSLTGQTLAGAKAKLKKANCAIGTIKRKAATKRKVGRVLAQTKQAGASLAVGTKVGVTLGRKA